MRGILCDMSDEPEEELGSDNSKRVYKDYSAEFKYSALAALDLNGGNISATAVAYEVPYTTLYRWNQERKARGEEPSELVKRKRGNLAAKLEDKIHSVVESITPEVIRKATLSQRSVFIGIGLDKLRILLGQGLDPDPASELCRLLNLNRSQLPPVLELKPGEEIPAEFAGPVIETVQSTPDSYEPQAPDDFVFIPEAHHPDCLINPHIPDSCSCGADDRNQIKLKAQDDESIN